MWLRRTTTLGLCATCSVGIRSPSANGKFHPQESAGPERVGLKFPPQRATIRSSLDGWEEIS